MANNKLIAEFMGYENEDMSFRIPKHLLNINQENDCPNSRDIDCWDIPLNDLQFNTSWDWLMPVVGKITNKCEEPEELDELRMALLCNDIDTAYSEVIDLVELLNNLNDN